jgi:hypothetical protein
VASRRGRRLAGASRKPVVWPCGGRSLLAESPAGYLNVTWQAPLVIACGAATSGVLQLPVLAAAFRRPSTRQIAEELACVNAIAVLLSPIAWEHYWVAWFPVLLALRVRARHGMSPWVRWSFVGAFNRSCS